MHQDKVSIRQGAIRVFHERADEYDSWYENSLLFDIELAALRGIEFPLPPPRLELGVGPGRFAEALAVDMGIDPALAPLDKARQRGIMPMAALGEHLPLANATIGTIYLLFTLCFLERPERVLRECHRVLFPAGVLVIGLVPAESAWGALLTAKGRAGHPYYRHASLYTIEETLAMGEQTGFSLVESRSTLFQPPDHLEHAEPSIAGHHERAGFTVLILQKKQQP